MYSHSPGSNVNIEFVPRHRLTDREIGSASFDSGRGLPACATRAMTDGFNLRRKEALAYQVSMAKRLLTKAGRDISELDEAICEMVTVKCGIEKAAYFKSVSKTDADGQSLRRKSMNQWLDKFRATDQPLEMLKVPAATFTG